MARSSTKQKIIVTGAGFLAQAQIAFSGTGIKIVSHTTISSAQIDLIVTVSATATTGPRKVTITNPDGGSGSQPSGLMIT